MEIDVHRSFNFMDRFPELDDLIICRNVSAHDKKGGNDNGFSNKAEYIRLEGERTTVLLDAVGPGVIHYFAAFWKNHPVLHFGPIQKRALKRLGRTNFYFDGDEEPRRRCPLTELTGRPPYVPPLAFTADQSVGSTVSYLPMPFQQGVKVTQDGGKAPAFGLHFWWHGYPPGSRVRTWRPGDEVPARAVDYFRPETAGEPAGEKVTEHRDLRLEPGRSVEVFAEDRAGTVKCIRMEVPPRDSVLRDLWLRAWWDDDEAPSVEAPLSLLFAIENRFADDPRRKRPRDLNAEFKGVIVGQDPEGRFFVRLPMPFNRRARVVIENRTAVEQSIAVVRIESDPTVVEGLGTKAGYLRTQFRENHDLPPGRDVVLLESAGRGKLAGVILAVEDTPECFLEGDERIYVDGSRTPAIIGDATETFFNGSWYFLDRAFACPIHGAPTFRLESYVSWNLRADVTMYRFLPLEFVPFRDGIRFSIQHGGLNEVLGHYRSLVFYYHLPEPSLVRTDRIDLSSLPPGATAPKKLVGKSGFFEGENNGVDIGTLKRPRWMAPIWWMIYWTLWAGNRREPPADSPDRRTFTVAEYDGPHQFTMKIDPEADAVILRRVLDQSVFDQRARVEVDGEYAATWFNTGNNEWKIWAEDDLMLAPETTRGKSEITVRIVPESPIWTVVEYTGLSVKTPREGERSNQS